MELIVTPSGNCRCVYGEDLDLSVMGTLQIERGSHVEPDENGRWMADLSPVAGPKLGPFATRSEALRAEAAWLHEYWLLPAPVEAFETD